jgi:predicted transcriptional regulator
MRTHRGRDRGYALPAQPSSKEQKRAKILAALADGKHLWASEIAHEIGLQPSSDRVLPELRALAEEGLVVRIKARGRDLWRLATPATAVGGAA